MSAKQKIVQGRGPSNINLGIFVCSNDVCRLRNHSPLLTTLQFSHIFIALFRARFCYTRENHARSLLHYASRVRWRQALTKSGPQKAATSELAKVRRPSFNGRRKHPLELIPEELYFQSKEKTAVY